MSTAKKEQPNGFGSFQVSLAGVTTDSPFGVVVAVVVGVVAVVVGVGVVVASLLLLLLLGHD